MPQQIKPKDKFEHWLVLEEAPSHISPGGTRRKMYKCKCDCGTIKTVSATLLRTGKSTSCGCRGSYLLPNSKYQDWTVIEKSEETDNHGSQFYLCKCECGVIRPVRMADLLNGSSKNCGHSRQKLSQGAQAIKQFLIDNDYNFYQEYIFSNLPNRRYDFAIFDKNNPEQIIRLIEFDGEQHCLDSRSNWHTEDLMRRDKEKNKFALDNNIPLVRIPYYKTSISYKDVFGEKFLVEEE